MNEPRPWDPGPPTLPLYRPAPEHHSNAIDNEVKVPFYQAALIALAWGGVATVGLIMLVIPLEWPPVAPVIVGMFIALWLYLTWKRRAVNNQYRDAGHKRNTEIITAVTCLTFSILGACLLFAVLPLPWWLVPIGSLSSIMCSFAYQLTDGIQERRRLLWQREIDEDRDIDGDGYKGRPPTARPIIVHHHGTPPKQDELPPEMDGAGPHDIMDDLALFIEEAQRRGLGRPQWIATGQPRALVGTTKVTRGVYQKYLDALLEMGVVEKTGEGHTFIGELTAEELDGRLDDWLDGDGVPK